MVASNFDPDFYVACATVIPIFFIAVTVQSAYTSLTRASLNVLREGLTAVPDWVPSGSEVVASGFLQLIAGVILAAGVIGEGVALTVLFQESEHQWERWVVFIATLVLVVTVAAVPFLASIRRPRPGKRGGTPHKAADAADERTP